MKRGYIAVLVVLVAVLVALVLPGTALATDTSSTDRVYYEIDNYSDGYKIAYPHNAWRGFDMVYYKEQVWQSFYQAGPTTNLDDAHNRIGVFITPQDANVNPTDKPTQYHVAEGDLTWSNSDWRVTADRLIVFKDRLFLYYAMAADGKGFYINQKELDGTNWSPTPTRVFQFAQGPLSVRGMVVKVVNDTLVILYQQAGSASLYMITSTDAQTFSAPERIYTFSGPDCLLNGNVIPRPIDGSPVLAFVTKDDQVSGDDAKGVMKMWTLDLNSKTVNSVWTFAHTYKDMVIVPGDVLNCTPYSTTAVQVWAIGSGTENLYHMQFLPNDNVTGGTCTDILDAGNVSKHIELSNRGYLAACPTAIQVTDPTTHFNSLDQRIRVWWWHDVNSAGTNAFGASTEYTSDYLKGYGPRTQTGSKLDLNDSWILQGIITGLPPFYPNATIIDRLFANNEVKYGLDTENKVETTLTSKASISVGYKAEFKGIGSVGFSCTAALDQATQDEYTTSSGLNYIWDPGQQAEISNVFGGMEWCAAGFGVFLVPNVTNEKYLLCTPTGQDLGMEVYYTYITAGANSLVTTEYDMTQRSVQKVQETTAVFNYFQGSNFKLFPKSTDYWLWKNDDPVNGTWVNTADDNPDYGLMPINVSDPLYPPENPVPIVAKGNGVGYHFTESESTTDTQKFTYGVEGESSLFGWTTKMSGEVGIESSVSSSVSTTLEVKYGINGWLDADLTDEQRADLGYYLAQMTMEMYWLQAKTQNAFFVPDGAKIGGLLPWCITWHVDDYLTGLGLHEVIVGGPRVGLDPLQIEQLPAGLRASLAGKLKSFVAAYKRGQTKTALNILHAIRNEVAAQSGKQMPADRAERWLQAIDRIFELKSMQTS